MFSLFKKKHRKQAKFDRWITKLEETISKSCSDLTYFEAAFEAPLVEMGIESGGKAIFRLVHSMVNVLGQKVHPIDQPDVLACWLIYYFGVLISSKTTCPTPSEMAQKLETHLEAIDPTDKKDIRVRNICMTLSILLSMIDINVTKRFFTDKLVTFVEKAAIHNSNYTQLFALICLETFSEVDDLKTRLSEQLKPNLKVVLHQLSLTAEELNLEALYNHDQSYVLHVRIGVYARWLLDHLFGEKSLVQIKDCEIKLVTTNKFDHRKKVTRDNYFAFGCDIWQNYQCSKGIDPQSGDVFYYEAILFTHGPIFVGWDLKLDREEQSSESCDKKDKSIDTNEIDKSNRKKICGDKDFFDLPPIEPCDIVGCLLDTSNGTFKLYLNGNEIPRAFTPSKYKMQFSSGHYYPTVCLSLYQQMYFNFGQVPFRFAPSGIEFRAICDGEGTTNSSEVVDIEKENKFAPVKSEEKLLGQAPSMTTQMDECANDKSEAVDDDEKNVTDGKGTEAALKTSLIEPVNIKESEKYLTSQIPSTISEMSKLAGDRSNLSDTKQKKLNEWMRILEVDVRNSVIEYKEIEEQLREFLLKLVKSEQDWIKLARSMITEMGTDARVDVMALWMTKYMKLLMPPSPDKVIQQIQPYLESYINQTPQVSNQVTSNQLRNICILLLIMPRVYQNEDQLKVFVTSEMINFLVKLASPVNEHKSSKLFALFCIQSFVNSCSLTKSLLKSLFIKREDFEKLLQVQPTELTLNTCDYDLNQIHFLSVHLLDCVFGGYCEDSSKQISNDELPKVSRLSTERHYYYGLVDFKYQSEMRINPVPVIGSMYFYEAILMTSGSARVGWALSSDDRRGNTQCLSIFFDAYQKRIYLDDKSHPIEKCQTLKQLKPGTVIGCLLNISTRSFTFYLDGDLVPFSTIELCLSTRPYLPTVSLAAYQHVCLNYGQTPFKYPPNEIQHPKGNVVNEE